MVVFVVFLTVLQIHNDLKSNVTDVHTLTYFTVSNKFVLMSKA